MIDQNEHNNDFILNGDLNGTFPSLEFGLLHNTNTIAKETKLWTITITINSW